MGKDTIIIQKDGIRFNGLSSLSDDIVFCIHAKTIVIKNYKEGLMLGDSDIRVEKNGNVCTDEKLLSMINCSGFEGEYYFFLNENLYFSVPQKYMNV